MVKEGVVAVDVGIHAVKDEETGKTRMVGDLDFDVVAAKAEAITPVPRRGAIEVALADDAAGRSVRRRLSDRGGSACR